jgi:exopolysaccharide biosynthesis protein
MKKYCFVVLFVVLIFSANAQTGWVNIDAQYQPLPSSFHVYKSSDPVDGKPNIMYYAIADLKDKNLKFTTDTTYKRRLTPDQFYQKNDKPLLVVNCSFFSFATNQNLNVVMKDGKLLAYNQQTIAGRKKDTLTYFHSFFGALGISKKRNADIAWVYSDSSERFPYASETPVHFFKDSVAGLNLKYITNHTNNGSGLPVHFSKWKMETAIGGGPVLVQNGEIKISNNEERKFSGRAAFNREPRTAIGYTRDHQLIILVCEGRSDTAAGLTLIQEAEILKDLNCEEALNLDGGGSSCMLINGKETNSPSSKGVQRPVPSVFLIEKK